MASPNQILQMRYELADTDVSLPIMSDSEYAYYVDKHSGNIRRAMLDAAKAILLKLSMRPDETVDIFSVRGSKAAEQYRLSLAMFLKDPNLNPALTLAGVYAGGISKSDMLSNVSTIDNNAIVSPAEPDREEPLDSFEV
jgi:hypothetical protein